MKETAMHILTAIVFAGVASLALATLYEPAEEPAGASAREIEISANINDNLNNIADDWRFSVHESIQEQTREWLRTQTRQGLKIGHERIAFPTPAEPDSGLASLQMFQPAPMDAGRMLPE